MREGKRANCKLSKERSVITGDQRLFIFHFNAPSYVVPTFCVRTVCCIHSLCEIRAPAELGARRKVSGFCARVFTKNMMVFVQGVRGQYYYSRVLTYYVRYR